MTAHIIGGFAGKKRDGNGNFARLADATSRICLTNFWPSPSSLRAQPTMRASMNPGANTLARMFVAYSALGIGESAEILVIGI